VYSKERTSHDPIRKATPPNWACKCSSKCRRSKCRRPRVFGAAGRTGRKPAVQRFILLIYNTLRMSGLFRST